ncbi:hypothetical protein [Paenibacillus sp. FSL L8-0158]|uniref:hypothetical protein n=1 Tax=Paenibacillus sp. FSL L8-0158 TaxID=2954752 RepID=UPI0031586ECD
MQIVLQLAPLLQNNSARSAHRPPVPQQVFKQEVWGKNKSKGDGKPPSPFL